MLQHMTTTMRRFARSAAPAVAAAMLMMPATVPAEGQVDRVIARLNEDIITLSDVAEAAAQTGRDDRLTTDLVGAVLDRTLLLQAARKAMVTVPDEEIDSQVEGMIAELRAHYASEAEFRQALLGEHITLEKLKADLKRKAATDFKLFRAVSSRFSLADSDVERYEQSALANGGAPPEMYHLRQLSVPVTGEGRAGRDAALSRVAALLDRINAEGLGFAEGVKRHSGDVLAKATGGDLGYVSASTLAPPVVRAVKDLKPGEVTPPMITGANASIFYLEAKRGARTTLFQQRFTEERTKLLAELRAKAHLQVFDPDFTRFVPAEYRDALRPVAARTGQTPVPETDAAPAPQHAAREPAPTARPNPFRKLIGR